MAEDEDDRLQVQHDDAILLEPDTRYCLSPDTSRNDENDNQIVVDDIPKRNQDAGFSLSKLSLILLTRDTAISGKVSSKN